MAEVEYARGADGTHLAYRVLCADHEPDDPVDIVMVSGGLFPIEVFEDDPGLARLLDGLRALGRLVIFDRRGIGLSDPIADWDRGLIEQWVDDLEAVVDAAALRDPVVFSWDNYGVASRYAVRHPSRVRMLVLDQPICTAGPNWAETIGARRESIRGNIEGSSDSFTREFAPSRADDAAFREWYLRAGRLGASPATALRIWEALFASLGDDDLTAIAVPTLVLSRRGNLYFSPDIARAAAAAIEGSILVELDGADHVPWIGDVDSVVAEIAEFITGERRLPPPDRMLAAVMFTDIVGSTERAAALGDARWKSLLDRHDAAVRAVVGNAGGHVVKTTGDGVLALLPSAGAGVRAARQIRDRLATEGLDVRIGIHVGDVDQRGDDVSGLAVNVAARAMARAADGDVVVTASVPVAAGDRAGTFESMGLHELKGVPGTWELYRLAGNGIGS